MKKHRCSVNTVYCCQAILTPWFGSDIYLYSALHKIVAKQLHTNKQQNNSLNVVKLISCESSVSAVKPLSDNSVILQKLFFLN